jgi:hypothetical protein
MSDGSLANIGARMLGNFRNGLQLRSSGDQAKAATSLQAAYAALSDFKTALQNYDDASAPQDLDDAERQTIAEAIDFSQNGDDLIAAFYNHCQATLAMASAEFGNASTYYSEASRLFQACAGEDEISMICLAHVAKAQALQAESQKFIRDANKGAGSERLSAAISLMHEMVMPNLGKLDPADAGGILLLLAAMKSGKSINEMQEEVVKGDYASALSTAKKIYEDVGKMREDAKSISLSAELSQKISQLLTTMTLGVSGLEALALAGKACEEQSWETFELQADIAKQRFKETQEACLMNRETVVFSAQWGQLIEVLVEPTRRHGRQLRDLYKDVTEWKEGFRSLAGKAGTHIDLANNVQAMAEARNKAEQTVTVHVTVGNYFQDRTTEALLGLKATLNLAPADLPERDELLQKLAQVTAVPKDDPSWLEKMKTFTGDAQKIVGNIAKIAAPVASAWNMLAPLFGMPALPIPV